MRDIILGILTRVYGERLALRRLDKHLNPKPRAYVLGNLIPKYGPEAAELMLVKYNEASKRKNTLDGFISRYGEELGKQKYLDKNKKLSVSVEALRNAGKTDDEIRDIRNRHSKNSPITLELSIQRYGDELGSTFYNQYVEKHKNISVRCVNGWISRGYSHEDAVKMVSDVQNTSTLDKFISRYGDDLGLEKYIETNTKKTAHITLSNGVSELETLFLNDLDSLLSDSSCCFRTHPIQDGELTYYCDYFHSNTRKIIEVFGDFWHMNPEKYSCGDMNNVMKARASDVWEKDKKRLESLHQLGYSTLVVWEADIKKDRHACLIKAKEFIDED